MSDNLMGLPDVSVGNLLIGNIDRICELRVGIDLEVGPGTY